MPQNDFHIIDRITRSITDIATPGNEFTQNLLLTAAVLFALWLTRTIILRIIARKTSDPEIHYKARKYLTRTFFFIAILILGRTWFEGFQSVATFLGILSAALVIALKDSVADLAGWLFLLWLKPFATGDRIEIAGVSGDVIELRMFKFSLMEIGNWVDADQSTGRIVHVPNHKIFTENISNYTADFPFIWNELPIRLSLESNWKKAKELLQAIAARHSAALSAQDKKKLRRAERSYLINYRILTPTVYTDVKDFGIALTIRYLTDPRTRRKTEQKIWEDVLTEFAQHDDIAFAYPTIRYYDRGREGNSGWGLSADTDKTPPQQPGS